MEFEKYFLKLKIPYENFNELKKSLTNHLLSL